MKNIRLLIAGIAITSGLVQAATVTATYQGQYNSGGTHLNNNNYIAGDAFGFSYRNFFVFNLASLSGTVTSATLNLAQPSNGYSSGAASEVYELFDVSTAISTLTAGTGGVSAFTDLGSGTSLGTVTVNSATNGTTVQVAFNSAGLAAIQAALGGQFAVGGALAGAGSSPRYTFGSTASSAFQTLDINFGSGGGGQIGQVPEPGTILTLGAGLVAIGLARFRNRK